MIGLRDLQRRDVTSWDDAAFEPPSIDSYNIAADCLRGPADATALLAVDGDDIRRVTVAELDERTARLAAGLHARGFQPADRVAIKLSQSIDMAVAIFAVLRAGGVVVPVSNVLGDDGVRYRLGDSDPRIMIAAGSEQEAALAAELAVMLVATEAGGDRPARTAPPRRHVVGGRRPIARVAGHRPLQHRGRLPARAT